MPQSSSERTPLGGWSAFLVAFLLGVGAIWVQAPFKPERPAEAEGGLPSLGIQAIDARLWQDPFAAVAKARKASKPADEGCRSVEIRSDGNQDWKGLPIRVCPEKDPARGYNLQWLSRQIEARIDSLRKGASSADGPPLTVLAVMVSGGPSTGAGESRRRYRYATLSALMLEGYFPDDAEHIGYVDLGPSAPPEYVPFEWFARARPDRPRQALLLLWLDDTAFRLPQRTDDPGSLAAGERPLARLSQLLTELVPKPADATKPAFGIVGPANSATLQAMAEEHRAYVRPGDERAPAAVARMWSPIATIPDTEASMGRRPLAVCDKAQPHGVCVRPPGVGYSPRTIATDDVLMEMLAQELGRRGVVGETGVALVGQLDTPYSRELANLFERSWGSQDSGAADGKKPSHIKRFGYLRGLDGQIPGAAPEGKADAGDAQKDRDIERPHGDAQLDYLRRMREELLAEDARLRGECQWREAVQQRCGLRAIGVLGNDYYDKLLVLQALKPVFPGAVFFTTDLDAAMFHLRDNRYTRNLLVASGFGLTLDKGWQGEIPPLRDSYQTAMVLAVRMAVQSASGNRPPAVETPPPARLFEIGRTQPVELVTRLWDRPFRRQVAVPGSPAGVEPQFDPHPADTLSAYFDPHQLVPLAFAAFAALAPLLALAVAVIGWERTQAAIFRWPVFVASATIVSTVAISIFFAYRDIASGGEPLSLVEGVSIWPSEVLRLIAGFFALFSLVHGYRERTRAHNRILAAFPGLSGPDEDSPDRFHTADCSELSVGENQGQRRAATDVWTRYIDKCGLWATAWRVLVAVALLFVFALVLMVFFGFPNHPTRSPLSWYLDLIVILLVLMPFLGLLFFMVQATRQALDLADELALPLAWPASTLKAFGLSNWTGRNGDAARGGVLAAPSVWLNVKLIARISKPVGDLVWHPILVLILIALARHPWFDAWTLPPSLLAVMLFAIVIAIACALLLRRAAERARDRATKDLARVLLRAQGKRGTEVCQKQIEALLKEIAEIREGAFRPFSQQPIVQALLTLASSLSGLALLEYSSAFGL